MSDKVMLGEIIAISKGRKNNSVLSEMLNGSRRYIQIDDLRNDFNLKYTIESGVEVNYNDLIIAWDGANAGTIGFNLEGYIGSTLARLRIKSDDYYTGYLGWFLKSKFKHLRENCTGATIPHINKHSLENLLLPKTNFKTQQKIAQILSDVDKTQQLRRTANALTDQFLQSIFWGMFGDPVSNVKGWKTETILSSGSKVQIGPFGTQLHVEDYVEGGIPLINPTHIQNSKIKEDNKFTITPQKFDELSNYHLTEGDIIMGRRGEMGRCALVTHREQGWLCGTGSLFIRPSEKLDSLYLLYVLTSKSFKETLENEAKGVTMANLNKTIINNLLIPIPPIKLQQQFAVIVADTEQLRQRQRAHEMELEQLFKSLLQKYFG